MAEKFLSEGMQRHILTLTFTPISLPPTPRRKEREPNFDNHRDRVFALSSFAKGMQSGEVLL